MRTMRSNLFKGAAVGFSLAVLATLTAAAAPDGDAASNQVICCKKGDTTPPIELVKQVPPGGIHSPYDWKELAKEDPDLVKQFRLPGCNECHGGTGGGGMCPALTQGVWFWGNTDDILFRLATLGSAELEKEGFTRYQYGSVHARCRRWEWPSRLRTNFSRSLRSFARSILLEPIRLKRWSPENTRLREVRRSGLQLRRAVGLEAFSCGECSRHQVSCGDALATLESKEEQSWHTEARQ